MSEKPMPISSIDLAITEVRVLEKETKKLHRTFFTAIIALIDM